MGVTHPPIFSIFSPGYYISAGEIARPGSILWEGMLNTGYEEFRGFVAILGNDFLTRLLFWHVLQKKSSCYLVGQSNSLTHKSFLSHETDSRFSIAFGRFGCGHDSHLTKAIKVWVLLVSGEKTAVEQKLSVHLPGSLEERLNIYIIHSNYKGLCWKCKKIEGTFYHIGLLYFMLVWFL